MCLAVHKPVCLLIHQIWNNSPDPDCVVLCYRMKRGRISIQSKCQAFPTPGERTKRRKRGVSRFTPVAAHPGRSAEDWGNLPHHVVLQIFQYLSLVDRARASSVCRRWNDVFHIPDLWRKFEFELNQPATSYLRSTHPDLIQQIIKKHAQHLQYVSFKVKIDPSPSSLSSPLLSPPLPATFVDNNPH